MAAVGQDLRGALGFETLQRVAEAGAGAQAEGIGDQHDRAEPARFRIVRRADRFVDVAQLAGEGIDAGGAGLDRAGFEQGGAAAQPVPAAAGGRLEAPREAVELAEPLRPVIGEGDGAGAAGLALRHQVADPSEAVDAVGEMARRHFGGPGGLAVFEDDALLADAPDAGHQRFAAPVVRGQKILEVEAEGVRAVAGEFQLLQRGDFRVLAGHAAEAAPERGVIAAGPGPVGQEIFAAV